MKNGIDGGAVRRFLEALDAHAYRLHALMIWRSGRLLYADAASPYTLDTPHRLCSAAKSILVLSALKAIEEGKLSLTDRVCDFFPEETPVDPRMRRMTVEDLFTMRTGQEEDPFPVLLADVNADLIHEFFRTPLVEDPGQTFRYNNTVPHMIYAVTERAVGMSFECYQSSRFLSPMNAPLLAPTNGKGQYNPVLTSASARTMMAFARLYLQEGTWQGTPLLDPALIRMACMPRVHTGQDGNGAGYGYQLWMNRFGGYRMDGGWGQYALILPRYEAAVVVLSDMTDSSYALEAAERFLLPGFEETAEGEDMPRLKSIFPVGSARMARDLAKGSWQMEDGSCLRVRETQGETLLTLYRGEDIRTWRIGLDGGYADNPDRLLYGDELRLDRSVFGPENQAQLLGGGWTTPNTLEFVGKCLSEMGETCYRLHFAENGCELMYPEAPSHGIASTEGNRCMKGTFVCNRGTDC